MLLTLNWFKFKLGCDHFRMLNIITMVTKNIIAIRYTQKEMIGALKSFSTKKSTRHERGIKKL